MGKKKRKNRQQKPVFVFTQETVRLTLRALALFDEPLLRANHLDEKVVFAEETLQRVRRKLELMLESVGHLCLTTFDYNEKIIIRQSLLLYTIELMEKPPGPQRNRKLWQCRQIAMHFTDEHKALT